MTDGSIYLARWGKIGRIMQSVLLRFAVRGEYCKGLISDWTPDIVHCHDWQAGCAFYVTKENSAVNSDDVHNIAFQGLAPQAKCPLGIERGFHLINEYFGRISTLKAG